SAPNRFLASSVAPAGAPESPNEVAAASSIAARCLRGRREKNFIVECPACSAPTCPTQKFPRPWDAMVIQVLTEAPSLFVFPRAVCPHPRERRPIVRKAKPVAGLLDGLVGDAFVLCIEGARHRRQLGRFERKFGRRL